MKKNLLLGAGIVGIAAFIVIGGGLIATDPGSDVVSETSTTTEVTKTNTVTKTPVKTTTTTAPIEGMKTSLGGIFAEKGNYQCNYESVSPQSRTSNVVYVSDGKMRGEFRTIEASSSKATLVVYDGSYLYVWTEGYSTGTVSQPKTIAELPGIIPEDVSSGRILGTSENNVSWNCFPWSKDASKLVKPSYVKFI